MSQNCPSTALRAVPLPIACGDREDRVQKIQAPAMKAPTAMIQSRASSFLMKSISASLLVYC
jgi:hypothetical protein